LNSGKSAGWTTLEKSKLMQARTLAQRRHDYAEVAEIDAKLLEFETAADVLSEDRKRDDMLAKVSERNRKANLEAMRRIELAEAERRRNERKNIGRSGTSTPVDPSARLRTVPRTFNNAAAGSAPGTPGSSTPTRNTDTVIQTPKPASANGTSFESSVLNSVDLDLGDF
jgi:RNA polymerase-associated protein RTF1